jgi:hypothetical protein
MAGKTGVAAFGRKPDYSIFQRIRRFSGTTAWNFSEVFY